MANEQPITPLILNLLVEEQMAERKKARDPLKAVVAVAIGIITVTVGVGTWFGAKAERKHTELVELQQQHKRLLSVSAAVDAEALKAARTFCEEILAMNRNRALFAPQLALIKEIIPGSIQLTRVSLGITTELREAPVPASEGKVRRPAAPVSIDYLTMVLEGRAISARPEIEVDDFLKAMRSDPRLKDKVKQIQLRSIAPAPVVAGPGGATPTVGSAVFVIDCQYKELSK